MTGVVVEIVVPRKGSGKQNSLRVDWDDRCEKGRKEVKICNIQVIENAQQPTHTKEHGTQERYVPAVGVSL